MGTLRLIINIKLAAKLAKHSLIYSQKNYAKAMQYNYLIELTFGLNFQVLHL